MDDWSDPWYDGKTAEIQQKWAKISRTTQKDKNKIREATEIWLSQKCSDIEQWEKNYDYQNMQHNRNDK